MINNCKTCNKEIKTYPSLNQKFCNNECYNIWKPGHRTNTGKTLFKDGQESPRKNKFKEIVKSRRPYLYRRLIFEESNIKLCNRCSKEAKLVHHKNKNELDNRIENLEPLCYSCHNTEHETGNK